MTFEEWLGDRIEIMSSHEYAAEKAAWEAGAESVVNSKLTPEGYVLVPIDAATELLKAVYGNPEIIYSMIQAAQEEE